MTVPSLVLCVAIAALWIRSHFIFDTATYANEDPLHVRFTSLHGHFAVVKVDIDMPVIPVWSVTSEAASHHDLSDWLIV